MLAEGARRRPARGPRGWRDRSPDRRRARVRPLAAPACRAAGAGRREPRARDADRLRAADLADFGRERKGEPHRRRPRPGPPRLGAHRARPARRCRRRALADGHGLAGRRVRARPASSGSSRGVYRTTKPIPVHGEWKALLRLHRGNSLQGVPIYLPRDPAIPAAEVPAERTFVRTFVPDKRLLQREAKDGTSPAAEPWLPTAWCWRSPSACWAGSRGALHDSPGRAAPIGAGRRGGPSRAARRSAVPARRAPELPESIAPAKGLA